MSEWYNHEEDQDEESKRSFILAPRPLNPRESYMYTTLYKLSVPQIRYCCTPSPLKTIMSCKTINLPSFRPPEPKSLHDSFNQLKSTLQLRHTTGQERPSQTLQPNSIPGWWCLGTQNQQAFSPNSPSQSQKSTWGRRKAMKASHRVQDEPTDPPESCRCRTFPPWWEPKR